MDEDDFSRLAGKFAAAGLTNLAPEALGHADTLRADTAQHNALMAQMRDALEAVNREKNNATREKKDRDQSQPLGSSAVSTLPKQSPGETAAMLLAKSGDLSDLMKAQAASNRYVELYARKDDQDPKKVADSRDAFVSIYLIGALQLQREIKFFPHENDKELRRQFTWLARNLASIKLPDVLANGLVIRAKVSNEKKRTIARDFILGFQCAAYEILSVIYQSVVADVETVSADGKVKVAEEEPLNEETYKQAKDAYREYKEGRLDIGITQFLRLLESHPNSAYLRSMVGSCCSAVGADLLALGHYLRAVTLSPRNPEYVLKLLNELIAQNLFVTAFAIHSDFKKAAVAGSDKGNLLSEIEKSGACARIVTTLLGVQQAEISSTDYDGNAEDILYDLPAVASPWSNALRM